MAEDTKLSGVNTVGGQQGWSGATWLNEPLSWQAGSDGNLTVTAAPHTDFWRLTHDSGVRHSGHLFGHSIAGDFTVTVQVQGDYRNQYDQAGLMVHAGEALWLKTGVEWVDGLPYASVVATRDTSDWSLVVAPNRAQMWFRVTRHGATVEVAISADGVSYALFRQCTLTGEPVQVGPFCCSVGEGFTATFRDFSLAP